MTKGLRVLDDVADHDLPEIVAYHLPKSRAKAVAIVEEFERILILLRDQPQVYRARPHGWRVCNFRAGTYALYYREMEAYWLVAGVFHALHDPDWIQAQLLIRDSRR
jgi:hypothetical protein